MEFLKTDRRLHILWEDGERIVCRGLFLHPDGSRSTVLTVRPAAEHPSAVTLARLTHEYSLRDDLDERWAVRPLELVRDRGQITLVLEDPGGEPLERLLGAPTETGRFLHLAIGIVTALGKVHKRGLVHKDLKPAHILVNEGGQIWLTGFGIASRLPSERRAPDPPETIAGTLAYMAPEQTGRMNRSIDARSDLYALGVTLYEMLIGTLPFIAADPMEWVHCHIARQPVPPAKRLRTVPEPVSSIVMKLLAKTAEERYQTAAGVEHDLRRCLAEWEREGSIDDFPLGQQDTPDRLLISEKLYGRQAEIAALLAAFDRAVKGEGPELVVVSGYSGLGKSSVVNELYKVLVPQRGLFAAGKFDQYKRDIPYSTLAQAFQSLVRSLLGKSDTELSGWREALREALGPNGQLMVDLVPALEPLIGPQPPVSELPPQDAQRRFQLVFRRLLGVFARPEHPLALFLDDLQWLDAATLDLLGHLATQRELRNLLLVGAYRDNEVTPTHPLRRCLAAIRSAGGRVQEIMLVPLRLEDVGRLIAEALHCEPERVAPLAQLVHEKTAGNPFFTIQFLTALAEEGLLAFDHGRGYWSWELERIRAKGFTDNVVELMLGKLRRLPTSTQHALRLLACLGNSAGISTLALVRGESEEALHAALWAAVRAGLVVQLEGPYRFVHDRVQEAAYALTPVGERAAEHLRIGRLLAEHTPADAIEEHVFEIVSQLNRGAALLTAGEERERLAELNLLAGKRAKAATAYTSALTYFVAGAALLTDDCWEHRRELAFALALNRAECEFLTGALADAENRLTVLSSRAEDLLDLAAVTCLQEDLYTTLDRSDRSIEVALDYLRRVGVTWSAHPTQEEVRREYERMWQQIGSRPIEALLDLPRMADPVWRATMDVLTAVVSPALFTDQNLYCVVIGRMANLSLEHGNSDASSYAYAILGTALGGHFRDYKAAFRFGQLGFNLAAKLGLDRFKARVYLIFGHHVMPWAQPIRTSRSLIRLAIDAAEEAGDLTYAAYARTHLVTHLLASGDPLEEVQREAEAGLDFARQARFGLVVDRINGQLQLIRTLRGLTPIFGAFDDDGFHEERFEQHLEADPRLALAACWYWIRKLQARVLAGDHAAAIASAAQADRLLWTSPAFFERAEYHFYAALAWAAACGAARDAERTRHLQVLATHHRQLQEWAENCPENFENRAALVGAEIARIEGRALDAMDLYEQAIRSAGANGFVHNEALANELAARFYSARGFEKIAHAYLHEARYGYLRWGADGKVRQLDQLYPHLREGEPLPGPTSTIGAPVENLDLATVMKFSQAVSGEIVLEKLIDRLMRIVLENAGAQNGHLILAHDERLVLTAEAGVEQQMIQVRLHPDQSPAESALPASIINYVRRSRQRVLLADATQANPFSTDEYFARRQPKAVLCLPIMRQSALIGLLYLENNLTAHAFTSDRVAVLEMLASQAAISLENARLYADLRQENSDRKRAEKALREREARIRRLVESNIIGVFFWDFAGGITEANDAFLRSVGYSRQDLLSGNVSWSSTTAPEYRAADAHAIEELRQSGTCQPFEKEFIRKDGGRVAVLVAGATLEGSSEQGVAFILDLTERKAAEAERARLGVRLRQAEKMEAVGRLAGGIAHDFNNILGAILGYGELAQNNLGEGSVVRRHVDQVMQAAARAKSLVDRILAFSRSGTAERVPLHVQSVVEETLELLAASLPANVRLERRLDAVDTAVVGDATQFHQVIMNLCTNAVHAMAQSGVLTVVLDHVTAGERRLLSHGILGAGRYVRLSVSDTGIGIPPAVLERMFDPFFTTKRVGDGTGLGLALVHGIVAEFGGAIDVATQVGAGTTFTIWLPAAGEAPRLVAESPGELARGHGETVMIVDDERALVALAEETLAGLGYEPVGFDSSVAALQAFRAEPRRFDLVLTDETMPDLTGTDLAREIRQLRPDTLIILMSGYSSTPLSERAQAAGVIDVLRKPLVRRDIAEPVARALRGLNY